MHHYRGKLLEGESIQLDPANVFIQYHGNGDGPGAGWYGYLLLGSTQDVAVGSTYTLRLEDGRAGRLQVNELAPEATGKVRALFVGEGALG